MNGIMNENVIVKEFEFIKPLIHKIDSIIDNCCRVCHNKYFHTFEYICVYDIKLTTIGNNEKNILTISCKSMHLYDINKKLKIA